MFLQLTNLTKVFTSRDGSSEVLAVNDVSINIERGQFVTLLGPSGCGKTTTLRLIAGFEFPTKGRIVLDGQQINDLPPNRRDMAMVFQSYALFPHLSVFENIAYGLKIKRIGKSQIKQQVAQALMLTELTGLENRAPNQLSGGQQQRVALARALVMEPKVLLFDEPLSNLDAKLRIQMRVEIRRIQQELGITSVYVTHDQEEAMVLSDQIVIMDQGRIQQVGSAIDIYRRPVNRFVADFIGRANFLPVTVVSKEQEQGTSTLWQVKFFDQYLHVPAATSNHFAPGTPAFLLVRPESIALHLEPPPKVATGHAIIAGELQHTSYLGAQIEYEIAVADRLVTAVRYDPNDQLLYTAGATVYLELIPENIYLLPV